MKKKMEYREFSSLICGYSILPGVNRQVLYSTARQIRRRKCSRLLAYLFFVVFDLKILIIPRSLYRSPHYCRLPRHNEVCLTLHTVDMKSYIESHPKHPRKREQVN